MTLLRSCQSSGATKFLPDCGPVFGVAVSAPVCAEPAPSRTLQPTWSAGAVIDPCVSPIPRNGGWFGRNNWSGRGFGGHGGNRFNEKLQGTSKLCVVLEYPRRGHAG